MSAEVEQEYQDRISRMSPAERLQRSSVMLAWTRDQISRQIMSVNEGMSAEELKWQVALRLYGDEPEVARMIREKIADVSR